MSFSLVIMVFFWQIFKQTILIRSTIEAKLVILDSTYSKAKWLKKKLFEIPLIYFSIPLHLNIVIQEL